jgi:cephalosporin hydroxylase
MSNNFLDYNHPLQTIDSYVPGARNTKHQGGTLFFHLWMSQNQNGPIVFDTIFKHFINSDIRIGRIIELGTAHGGLSVLFGMFACSYGCKYITYDIHDTPNYKDLFKRLDIDFRKKDIFANENEIAEEIKKEDITILFCDGGDKIKEFNIFSKYLKKGDVILAHDYAQDDEFYKNYCQNNIWSFYEINYASIKDAVEKNNLKPFLEDVSVKAAICSFQKS